MLPAEIQTYVYFAAGVSTAAKESGAARSFVRFLSAPAAVPIMKSKGIGAILSLMCGNDRGVETANRWRPERRATLYRLDHVAVNFCYAVLAS